MNLEFSDVTYTVNRGWKDKGDGRIILHGVNGAFRSGQLTAIMGPSGAGKSTLLNVISGYSTHGVKGSIKVNGKPLQRQAFRKYSRYITQEDQLPAHLTTGEAMNIAASLKLPSTLPKEEINQIIKESLSLLRLENCYDTPTDSLSGGQRKRLSIALELINNPFIFFLDEPTSGLDDVSTKLTLELLTLLAKGGRTIVCTIHQPSAKLFDMFDMVYVLGRGRCVYQGTTKNLLPFLSSAGFRCPTYHNPADHVIEVVDGSDINISVLSKAMENGRVIHSQSNEKIHQLDYECNGNEPTESHVPNKTSLIERENGVESTNKHVGTPYFKGRNSFMHQFSILFKRLWIQTMKNKLGLYILFLHHIGCAILVGLIFYQGAKDASQMLTQLKLCVCYVFFHTYTYIIPSALSFPSEVKVLKKEHFNGWYDIMPYYVAQLFVKIPGMIFFGLQFDLIVYFLVGIPAEVLRFTLFAFIGFITAVTADSLGMAIGSTFNITNASIVGPASVAVFIGLSVYGYDFAKEIPRLTNAIMKLSFMRCGTVATVLTIFGFNREPLECPDVYCHFRDPKTVLQFIDQADASVWSEIGMILLILLVFKFLGYIALRMRVSVK